jgi:hypothetical protein
MQWGFVSLCLPRFSTLAEAQQAWHPREARQYKRFPNQIHVKPLHLLFIDVPQALAMGSQ